MSTNAQERMTLLVCNVDQNLSSDFFGWRNGEGSLSIRARNSRGESDFAVVTVPASQAEDMGDVVHVTYGSDVNVVATGSREEMASIISGKFPKERTHFATKVGADYTAIAVGDFGSATVGKESAAIAGDQATAVAGNFSEAIAGDFGRATGGHVSLAYTRYNGHSKVTSGHAISGDRGHSKAGNSSHAISGNKGTSEAGDHGHAIAGIGGTAIVGTFGTATVGFGGRAKGGMGSALTFTPPSGPLVTVTVGRDAIYSDIFYVLDRDGKVITEEEATRIPEDRMAFIPHATNALAQE